MKCALCAEILCNDIIFGQNTLHLLILTVFQFICETGFVDDDNAKRIFPQIVEGIQYIHSLQVGHRDLKCENILLDKNKKVKVGECI